MTLYSGKYSVRTLYKCTVHCRLYGTKIRKYFPYFRTQELHVHPEYSYINYVRKYFRKYFEGTYLDLVCSCSPISMSTCTRTPRYVYTVHVYGSTFVRKYESTFEQLIYQNRFEDRATCTRTRVQLYTYV